MWLSMAMYSLHIVLAMKLVWELTANRLAVLIYAIVFSLFPNLFESFHWGAMIAVAYMQVSYVASALCWVLYVKRQQKLWLWLSVLFYAIGVTSYEFGALLPFVYAVLLIKNGHPRRLLVLLPFFAVLGLYGVWRVTKGFGMAQGLLFPPRDLLISFHTLFWNSKEVIRWWIGEHMLLSIVEGTNAFLTLGRGLQRLLIAVNLIAAGGLTVLLWSLRNGQMVRTEPSGALPSGFSQWQIVAFGLIWAAAGHSVNLVSWTAARLNFFPAIGVAIVLAWALSKISVRIWLPAAPVVIALCLVVNQGTAKSWRDAGDFQRNLYTYLRGSQSEWMEKSHILFDTSSLRHRQTRGLLTAPSSLPYTWAYYGNASLLRGFVPGSMMTRIEPDRSARPATLLDMEHGVRLQDGIMYWHARYDPSQLFETPLGDVYVIDAWRVGGNAAP